MRLRLPDGKHEELPADYLERVTLRHLQTVLAEATRGYWLRRAEQLDACHARPDDYLGEATVETIIARHERRTLAAEQCRIHARLFDHDSIDAALVAELLGWEWAEAITAAQVIDEDARAAEFERFTTAWRPAEEVA